MDDCEKRIAIIILLRIRTFFNKNCNFNNDHLHFTAPLRKKLPTDTDFQDLGFRIGLNHYWISGPPPSLHFFTPTPLFQWVRLGLEARAPSAEARIG